MKKRMLLYKRAKQLLRDNPNLSCKKFMRLTGLSKEDYNLIKEELSPSKSGEEIALKLNLKRKLIFELKQTVIKARYLNAKGTFLERS
jgi:5-bromo-4-chloroindolyl phosphate hydrolysis protein